MPRELQVAPRAGGQSLKDVGFGDVGLDDGWADFGRGQMGSALIS